MTLIWILGYLFAALLIWIGFSKQAARVKASTKQLFLVFGFLVLLLMIGLSLDKQFQWWGRFPKDVIGVVGILVIVDRLFRVTVIRWRSGALVLNLGKMQGIEMIINIALGALLGYYVVKDIVAMMETPPWTFAGISYDVFGLSIAIAVVIQGVSGRALFERGVFHGTGLIAWEKINRYGWEKESSTAANLVLYKQTPSLFSSSVNLSVRAEQMKEVEDILHQHGIERVGEAPKPKQ
jgi:hypothetical protein